MISLGVNVRSHTCVCVWERERERERERESESERASTRKVKSLSSDIGNLRIPQPCITLPAPSYFNLLTTFSNKELHRIVSSGWSLNTKQRKPTNAFCWKQNVILDIRMLIQQGVRREKRYCYTNLYPVTMNNNSNDSKIKYSLKKMYRSALFRKTCKTCVIYTLSASLRTTVITVIKTSDTKNNTSWI